MEDRQTDRQEMIVCDGDAERARNWIRDSSSSREGEEQVKVNKSCRLLLGYIYIANISSSSSSSASSKSITFFFCSAEREIKLEKKEKRETTSLQKEFFSTLYLFPFLLVSYRLFFSPGCSRCPSCPIASKLVGWLLCSS